MGAGAGVGAGAAAAADMPESWAVVDCRLLDLHPASARVASSSGAPTMAPIAMGSSCLPWMMATTGISTSSDK